MKKPATQYSLVIDSPLGRLGMLVMDQQVHRLDYLDAAMPLSVASGPFERRLVRSWKITLITRGRTSACR